MTQNKKQRSKTKVLNKLPTPKNPSQKTLINSIDTNVMTIVVGPAGTGKTYLTACYAASMLKEGRVKKIILTRPTIPTGKSIGFFPGSLDEKMAPWTIPVMSTLKEMLGSGDLECQIKNGNIEIVPFETIRGRSFEDCFVILDEAQNCTIDEIKAFVTRAGERTTVVINGDVTQSDLHFSDTNGLSFVLDILSNSKCPLNNHVGLIEFTSDDIVRSGLCQMWVKEFEALDGTKSRKSFEGQNVPDFLLPADLHDEILELDYY